MNAAAECKSEYYAGEMFAMAGGSLSHSLITANVTRDIGNRLKGKRCVPYDSKLRVKISTTGLYTYPDITVVCGALEFANEERDTIINPTLLSKFFLIPRKRTIGARNLTITGPSRHSTNMCSFRNGPRSSKSSCFSPTRRGS